MNPVGGMGNEVPQKLTFLVYFYAKYVISYFNKVGLLIFPFWDSTLCRLGSTFWLDSTLKLYCAIARALLTNYWAHSMQPAYQPR